MTIKVIVGAKIGLAIKFLDQSGAPMNTPPTPDAPPTWTGGSAVGTLTPSADGLDAALQTATASTDSIGLSLSVAGVSFSASLAVEVDPIPQVLTSIEITPTI